MTVTKKRMNKELEALEDIHMDEIDEVKKESLQKGFNAGLAFGQKLTETGCEQMGRNQLKADFEILKKKHYSKSFGEVCDNFEELLVKEIKVQSNDNSG